MVFLHPDFHKQIKTIPANFIESQKKKTLRNSINSDISTRIVPNSQFFLLNQTENIQKKKRKKPRTNRKSLDNCFTIAAHAI